MRPCAHIRAELADRTSAEADPALAGFVNKASLLLLKMHCFLTRLHTYS